jgi:hypothetical protein
MPESQRPDPVRAEKQNHFERSRNKKATLAFGGYAGAHQVGMSDLGFTGLEEIAYA